MNPQKTIEDKARTVCDCGGLCTLKDSFRDGAEWMYSLYEGNTPDEVKKMREALENIENICFAKGMISGDIYKIATEALKPIK